MQGLIRAEAAELRQRQATHAIFERMETARLERERLSKVADPESKRTKKVGRVVVRQPWSWCGRALSGWSCPSWRFLMSTRALVEVYSPDEHFRVVQQLHNPWQPR